MCFASQGGSSRAKCREECGEVAAKSGLHFAKKKLHFRPKLGLFSANESEVLVGIARVMVENVE